MVQNIAVGRFRDVLDELKMDAPIRLFLSVHPSGQSAEAIEGLAHRHERYGGKMMALGFANTLGLRKVGLGCGICPLADIWLGFRTDDV